MVKIKLMRSGVRNKPFYQVVAIDERLKKGGPPKAILGYWHPATNTKKIDSKTLDEFVKQGAQITKAVSKLISSK